MNGIGKNLKRIRLLKNLFLKETGNLLNMTANVKSIELLKTYNTPQMKFTSFI